MIKNPHGRQLRKGRVSIENHVYLVTSVTSNRQRLFQDLYAGREVVQALRYASDKGTAGTLAYVVMPDHVHWLLSLQGNVSLSRLVGGMKRHSARRVNALQGLAERGVWQRGFHDHALRSDESLPAVARYVVANPLRAGLVKKIGDYPLWDAVWL